MKIAFLAAALAACALARADEPKVTVKLPKAVPTVGGKLNLTVRVEFDPGLHGYQNPPSNEFQIPLKISTPSKGFKLTAKYPKGVIKQFNGEDTAVYEGTIEIPVTVDLPQKAGSYSLAIVVDYQQCNESACFPPGSIKSELKFKVAAKK